MKKQMKKTDEEQFVVYYISLEKDIGRRIEMSKKFDKEFTKMHCIEAIKGKNLPSCQYFLRMNQFFNNTKRLITPSELGCLMSHEKALQTFIDSDYKYALILEDDIIGSDSDINRIREISINLKENFFFHCGGMDPISCHKTMYGKKLITDDDYYLAANFSIQFLWRACSYAIDKNTAIQILKIYKKNQVVADEWKNILTKNHTNTYLANILHHPKDLQDSNLEQERLLKLNVVGLKLFKQKVIAKIYVLWNIFFYKRKGYEKIYKGKS